MTTRTLRTQLLSQTRRSGLWLLPTLLTYAYLVATLPTSTTTLAPQIICVIAALGLSAAAASRSDASLWWRRLITGLNRQRSMDLAWLIFLAILIVHGILAAYLPIAQQAGFEELQTGGNAYHILHSGNIAIEFRY